MANVIKVTSSRRTQRAGSDVNDLILQFNASVLYRTLNSPGFVIKAGGSALAKTGSTACQILVNGGLITVAASTDTAALSGTITAAAFNVWLISTSDGSTLTATQGTEGATAAAVVWPATPAGETVLGGVMVSKSDGTFTGGTTALDAANVTTAYINLIGGRPKTIGNLSGTVISS